jgi:hypothetical protein
LLEASPSKVFFMWSIGTCFLKYYSCYLGKSIINYFCPQVNKFRKKNTEKDLHVHRMIVGHSLLGTVDVILGLI